MSLIREDDPPAVVAGIVLVLAAGCLVAALRPLDIQVESPRWQSAPASVRLRVRVEPDAENRALEVVADGSRGYHTSSLEPLEGEASPRTRWITWSNLPPGDYVVIATVRRGAAEAWHARTAFSVLGP